MRPRRSYRLNRLRDHALRALVDHPDLSRREVAALRGTQIHQHGESGYLLVEIPQRSGSRIHVLGAVATRVLLDYMEAARLWGADRPLFPGRFGRPLSTTGINTALARLEDRD